MPIGPDKEPENYTLDEMLQRLQERGHDESEMVTRADGTVAVKVRKRKRRSKQPIKEQNKRKQRVKILQLALFFLVIFSIIGVGVGMLFYYNSSSFRESTREKIAEWSAAEVEIAEFTVTPNNAKCATANFAWPEGNYLRQLQLSHASAQLSVSSFIGNKWGGTNVVSQSGKLTFSSAVADAAKRYGESPDGKPFPFAFPSYRCEKLEILGLGNNRQPWMTVQGTEASLIKTSRGTQTRFVGGLVNIANFQPLQLDRGSMYFEQGKLQIENLRLKPTAGIGSMEFQSNFELYSKENAKVDVLLTDFPLELLLGNGLELIMIGQVDTPKEALNRLFSFVPGDFSSLKIQIGFRGSERDPLTIMNLPFLDEFSREFRNPEYSRQYPFTDRVEGELLRQGNETRVQGLFLEKKGYFLIRGEISVQNGKLGGSLEVGLPSSQFVDPEMNQGVKEVFARQDNGYQWCRIELSGTPSQPKDNFASQVQQALAKVQGSSSSPEPKIKERELNIEKELEGE